MGQNLRDPITDSQPTDAVPDNDFTETILGADRTRMLDYLWAVQNEHRHIRREDIEACAQALGISAVEVEGVVSFYHFFTRRPAGDITIYLNRSVVAECKGYERVRQAFEAATGATMNSVDPTGQFGLFETSCIGLSDQEPAALINFHPFTKLSSIKVKQIVARLKKGADPAEICDPVPDNIRATPAADQTILLRDYNPGYAIEKLKSLSPEAVFEEIKSADLRGLGGGFFPVGLKWQLCREEPGRPKYIVCNADEGEPGTFKDRILLNSMPGLLLEGMAAAGRVVGASEGIIYLRAEYVWLLERLEQTIQHYRKMNLLGKNVGGIDGFNFDVRVQIGAGAYICGEETALFNSLEGKRGEPRNKRFFPTHRGYMSLPTVINNVETFCMAARILELGAGHYRSAGTPTSPGTKLLSVSGDCRLPGIYEIEWGTSVRDILEMCGADQPYFIQVSGPAGECLSMAEADRAISLDDLRCGGSFMIFNESRNILQILRNFTAFFKMESCGLCTPCRAGNFLLERKLDHFARKLARRSDIDEIRSWGEIMQLTCRCGLGKTAPNSLLFAQEKFPEVFEDLVSEEPERLNKGFDLDDAVKDYDRFSS